MGRQGESERMGTAGRDALTLPAGLPEPDLDGIALLARIVCGTAFALVHRPGAPLCGSVPPGLLESDAAALAALVGGNEHARPTIVPDMARDRRIAELSVVSGDAALRFCAGIPLPAGNGRSHGTLLVLDAEARRDGLTAEQAEGLVVLANQGAREQRILHRLAETTTERDDLRSITDAAPVLIAALDRDEVCRFANGSFSRWFGLEPEQAVGRPMRAVVGEDVYAAQRPLLARAFAGETVSFETPHPAADGRCVLMRCEPHRGPHHRIADLYLLGVDITAEKDARAALADSALKFRAIAESMPQMVWSTLPDGYHDYYNPRWYEFTGMPEGSTDGEGWNAIFHPAEQPEAWRRWRRSLATGEPYEIEYRLRRHDGVYRWVLGRAMPIRDPETGAIERWFGTCTDIDDQVRARETLAQRREALEAQVAERTAALAEANARLTAEMEERARIEEALRQAQKMEAVGQLTGGIAHDFNNLLTGIVGSLDLMQTRINEGRTENLTRYAGLAMASAQRAAALTHRLLAFARRQPLEARAVDVNRLVSAMDELLRRTLGERVQLEVVVAGGLWLTLCDPNQLENAILNLAINARDAMPEGGRLTIETANAHLDDSYVASEIGVRAGQYVCICISDTGGGMAPAVIQRAFDPFFTTKPPGQGTGLGLSMIYGFTKQSDGHVRIYSEVGQGTTVKLYLPRHAGRAADETAPAAALPVPRAERGETVLVVEDDATVRALIGEALAELGYRVIEAPDGPTGLRILEQPGRIDLVVTDVGLPGLNGRRMIDEALAARPGLRVLFITGYAENAAFGNGHLAPGMRMITKPFAIDAFAAKVRAMIEPGPS